MDITLHIYTFRLLLYGFTCHESFDCLIFILKNHKALHNLNLIGPLQHHDVKYSTVIGPDNLVALQFLPGLPGLEHRDNIIDMHD